MLPTSEYKYRELIIPNEYVVISIRTIKKDYETNIIDFNHKPWEIYSIEIPKNICKIYNNTYANDLEKYSEGFNETNSAYNDIFNTSALCKVYLANPHAEIQKGTFAGSGFRGNFIKVL